MVVGERPLILVRRDGGNELPARRAAVRALLPLGDVAITTLCEQQSGSGRSQPSSNDGAIHQIFYQVVDHSAQPRSDFAHGI